MIWGYVGLGGALVAAIVGCWIHDLRSEAEHSRDITALNKVVQDWKDSYDQLKDGVAKQREDQLAQQLREAQDRDKRERDLRAEQDRLRRLAAAEAARAKELGAELLRRLDATPRSPESRLDDGTAAYYRELRSAQCAAASDADAAAAGCPDTR